MLASTADSNASEHLNGYAVSANYFADLGVHARIGRTFLPDEDRVAGANAVVVLEYRFWQRRFQGDQRVLGQAEAEWTAVYRYWDRTRGVHRHGCVGDRSKLLGAAFDD